MTAADLKPLTGAQLRVKLFPCPEGQDARKGVKLGELTCDYCTGSPMAYVEIDKKGNVYAFHNRNHPKAFPEDGTEPCGCTLLKLNGPLSRNFIRHWTAQRYSKGTTTHVEKISPEKRDGDDTGSAKPTAAKPAAEKRPVAAAAKPRPAARPVAAPKPDDKRPATGGTGGGIKLLHEL